MYLHTAAVNVCDFRLYLDEQILQTIELQNKKLLDKYLHFEISLLVCLPPSLICFPIFLRCL